MFRLLRMHYVVCMCQPCMQDKPYFTQISVVMSHESNASSMSASFCGQLTRELGPTLTGYAKTYM